MTKLAAALCVSLLAFGCAKSKTLTANYQETITYFTHGSPLLLMTGATSNTSGLLPLADIANYDSFHMMPTLSFVEKSRISTVSSIEEVQEENRTDSESSESESQVPIYAFTNNGDGTVSWSPINETRSPVFSFDSTGDLLKLIAINGQTVEVLHYSLKDDKSAFSILVSFTQTGSGVVLASYTWGTTEEINQPVYTSGDFQYLIGSEKVSWSSTPSVKLCGTYSATIQSSVQESVKAWENDPEVTSSRTVIPYSVATSFPPFSDLNAHCIYVVNGFDMSDSPVAKTLGITTPRMNLANRRIIDSDIFLFADFIADELASPLAGKTTMHEMGHFFGLGHDFRQDASGNALHETIMGYSQGTDTVTAWDFEAIRELYTDSIDISL